MYGCNYVYLYNARIKRINNFHFILMITVCYEELQYHEHIFASQVVAMGIHFDDDYIGIVPKLQNL